MEHKADFIDRARGGADITFRVDFDDELEITMEGGEYDAYRWLNRSEAQKLLEMLQGWLSLSASEESK